MRLYIDLFSIQESINPASRVFLYMAKTNKKKKLSYRGKTARASCHWIFCQVMHSRSLKVIRN